MNLNQLKDSSLIFYVFKIAFYLYLGQKRQRTRINKTCFRVLFILKI
jgi:hypothetical protein